MGANNKMNSSSEEWYSKGNAYRQQQDLPHAMECYLKAVELDPESPARQALEMTQQIMEFYCRDYYNP